MMYFLRKMRWRVALTFLSPKREGSLSLSLAVLVFRCLNLWNGTCVFCLWAIRVLSVAWCWRPFLPALCLKQLTKNWSCLQCRPLVGHSSLDEGEANLVGSFLCVCLEWLCVWMEVRFVWCCLYCIYFRGCRLLLGGPWKRWIRLNEEARCEVNTCTA